jgi:hypothetical protein
MSPHGAEEVEDTTQVAGESLLAGFVWPFVVPAEDESSSLDLLKRSVEFASQPEVRAYREAFHRWSYAVATQGKTPRQAAGDPSRVGARRPRATNA